MSVFDNTVFDVREFGARGDGIQKDTHAIQAAVDACSINASGVVLFPKGQYLTSTIFIKSNVTIHLTRGATILGSKDIGDYSTEVIGCFFKSEPQLDKCLFFGHKVKNIAFTGEGVINGHGEAFPLKIPGDEKSSDRPMMFRFVECQNMTFTNLTFKSAGAWCLNIVRCDDVRVDGVMIHNRVNRNNDGIDIDTCHRVIISNCKFDCSDDAICFHNSFDDRDCRDIVIDNCILSSRWTAIRAGASRDGDIKNVTISNCIIYDTYGCGIKLQSSRGCSFENVTVSNIIMDNVTGPIHLRFGRYDCHNTGKEAEYGRFGNMLFNNIRAVVAKEPLPVKHEYEPQEGEQRSCISILGLPEYPIEDIIFSNIDITYPGGGTAEEAARRELPPKEDCYPEYFMLGVLPSYGLYARHAKGLTLSNVRFSLADVDMRPAVVCDNVEDLELSSLRAAGNPEAESLLRLQNTRRAFIHGCSCADQTKTFAQVEGRESKDIFLTANDLRKAKAAYETANGAGKDAVLV